MQVEIYKHKTQYYETDQMGIIHHSNYIRWFEEARSDILLQAGIGYDKMEEHGILSPVLHVNCSYQSMTHYGDTVKIVAVVTAYNGVKMTVGYEVRDDKTNELRAFGDSLHCFLNREGKPLSLKRSFPKIHEIFRGMLIHPEGDNGNFDRCQS